jgi:cell division protein FtsZ
MEDNLDLGISFDLPKNQSNVIKVIGVGGGGSNAINHMFKQGIKGVDFVICNTDAQALANSGVPNKIQLGVNLTEGLGAGANPEIGEKAALESSEDIMSMLNINTKMVFITAGMGGGTGTGAAPVIAKMAKDMNILTVGIVTTPFNFEGKIRYDQAQLGIEKLREQVDSLIIINNNKLRDVYGNLGFKAGFSKADEVLSTASKGIAEVITHHYTQNIDLKDAKTVLSNSGTAIMGAAISFGENRAYDAITKALDSPLLNDNKITGAKNVLLLIVSGNEEITIDEIAEINDYIQNQSGNVANIIMGVGEDLELEDSISVTVIATGFNADQQNEISNTEPEKIIHKLEEENLFSNIDATDESFEDELKVSNDQLDDQMDEEKIIHVLDDIDSDGVEESDEKLESSLGSTEMNIKGGQYNEDQETNDISLLDNSQDIEEETSDNSIEWSLFSDDIEKESSNKDKNDIKNIEVVDYEVVVGDSYVSDEFEIEKDSNNDLLFNQDSNVSESFLNQDVDVQTKMLKESKSEEKKDKNLVNSPISDFQKQRSDERKLRMKEFNYKFNKSKIEDLVDEPAYKRKGIKFDHDNSNEENNISRTSISLDENNDTKIRKNNSFLHDNVD